jgi:phosphoglycolate phosphatase
MAPRAVVFDLDGTLVDTAPDLWRATNHILASLGRRPIMLKDVRAFVGRGARVLIARGLKATGDGADRQTIERLHDEFVHYYGEHIAEGSEPFPGVIALLDRLHEDGVRLGVCTNKLEGLSVRLLEALELAKYFDAVVGPDTIGVAKPDPATYRETLSRMRSKIGRSVMIGDSETDVLTARAAGVPIIAVDFGYTPEPVADFAPDFVISHYDEAWPLIDRALDSWAFKL